MIRQQEEITALYSRLSQDDGREGESNSIVNHSYIIFVWANLIKFFFVTPSLRQ